MFIPRSVTSLTNGPFSCCSALSVIEVSSENEYFVTSDGVLFDTGMTKLIQFPCARGGDYIVPDSVTSVEGHAFSGCNTLRSISFSNTVTIGGYSFEYCNSLTSLKIPDSVTGIENSAFQWSISLTSVTIGKSVTFIGSCAFTGCSMLSYVAYTGLVEPSYGLNLFVSTQVTCVHVLMEYESTTFCGIGVIRDYSFTDGLPVYEYKMNLDGFSLAFLTYQIVLLD